MSLAELRARRAAVKALVAQIEIFPTTRLIEQLCDEAIAGIRCDVRCALGFAAVYEAARDLMIVGAYASIAKLAAEVSYLDTLVTVRLLQP